MELGAAKKDVCIAEVATEGEGKMTEAAMLRDRYTGQAVNQEDLTDIVNTICQPKEC